MWRRRPNSCRRAREDGKCADCSGQRSFDRRGKDSGTLVAKSRSQGRISSLSALQNVLNPRQKIAVPAEIGRQIASTWFEVASAVHNCTGSLINTPRRKGGGGRILVYRGASQVLEGFLVASLILPGSVIARRARKTGSGDRMQTLDVSASLWMPSLKMEGSAACRRPGRQHGASEGSSQRPRVHGTCAQQSNLVSCS